MNSWSIVLLVAVAIVLAAASAFFLVGPERIWASVGPADLGPASFETLRRRTSPNDSLACPPGLCAARSDLVPPVFATDVNELKSAFAKAIATEERIERVASEDGGAVERYIQRTRIMGFPDTIVVRFIDLGDGRSTLALYSRSQLGHSDFGVNRARIERWLAKLAKIAPPVATA
jgi:uncharacterized protein (DUF1499 family)